MQIRQSTLRLDQREEGDKWTTEEAATAALKEMNGKIINGWMIAVDVAKTNAPRHNRVRPRPTV
ncbi:Organelle RRM domain-containing protein 1, chloroplastic [Asimina triloba]